MDICFQREVLREATIYTTIAMGLHFLSQSEKVDFAFLAIPWQKTWNSSVYYYLRPPSVPFRLFHRPNSHDHSKPTDLKMGTFDRNHQTCPYSNSKNGTSSVRVQRRWPLFRNKTTPPPPKKMVEQTFVLRNAFTTFGRVNLMNLKKWNFWTALSPFTLSTDPRIEMQCKRAVVK